MKLNGEQFEKQIKLDDIWNELSWVELSWIVEVEVEVILNYCYGDW